MAAFIRLIGILSSLPALVSFFLLLLLLKYRLKSLNPVEAPTEAILHLIL